MSHIRPKPERGIVAAACQLNGVTFSMPPPSRHSDILESMYFMGIRNGYEDRGFLDHRGIFRGRKASMVIVHRWGQMTDAFEDGGELFSEHLW